MKGQQAQQMEAMRMKNMTMEKDLDTRSKMMIRNNDSLRKIDEIIADIMAKMYGEAGIYKAQSIIDKDPNQPGIQQ